MRPDLRHRLLNFVHSALLLGGMALICWICVAALFGGEVALWALLGVCLALLFAPAMPKELLLRMYRARHLGPHDFPAGWRMVQALARRAELPASPKLYYLPTSVPNAFAVGGPTDSVIAISDGLLRLLDRRELAGVLAHETAHIAHRDLWLMGLADIMARMTSMLSVLGQFLLLIALPFLLFGQAIVPLAVPLVLILAPAAMGLLQLALSRTREFDADRGAAELTGGPMALASALAKLERRVGRFWEDMFLPGRRMPEPSLLRTHPPTEERIRRLKELAGLPEHQGRVAARPVPPIQLVPVTRRPRMHWHGLWY